jgi:ABC-2 type transport system ATP-binding protein
MRPLISNRDRVAHFRRCRAPALLLAGVSKYFTAGVPGCCASVRALQGVDLRVERGEIISLHGPPGAGKTTLLLCAAKLLRPDTGVVKWFGAPDSPNSGSASGEAQYVAPQPEFRSMLCLREALTLYAGRARRPHSTPAPCLERVLELAAVAVYSAVPLARLPDPMRWRAGLAMALLHAPGLLLLDAPLEVAPLDERDRVSRAESGDVLRRIATLGIATVVSSRHDPGELERLVSRSVVLVGGRIAGASTARTRRRLTNVA